MMVVFCYKPALSLDCFVSSWEALQRANRIMSWVGERQHNNNTNLQPASTSIIPGSKQGAGVPECSSCSFLPSFLLSATTSLPQQAFLLFNNWWGAVRSALFGIPLAVALAQLLGTLALWNSLFVVTKFPKKDLTEPENNAGKGSKGQAESGMLGKKNPEAASKGKSCGQEIVHPCLARSSPGLSVLIICTRFLCFPYPWWWGERERDIVNQKQRASRLAQPQIRGSCWKWGHFHTKGME